MRDKTTEEELADLMRSTRRLPNEDQIDFELRVTMLFAEISRYQLGTAPIRIGNQIFTFNIPQDLKEWADRKLEEVNALVRQAELKKQNATE